MQCLRLSKEVDLSLRTGFNLFNLFCIFSTTSSVLMFIASTYLYTNAYKLSAYKLTHWWNTKISAISQTKLIALTLSKFVQIDYILRRTIAVNTKIYICICTYANYFIMEQKLKKYQNWPKFVCVFLDSVYCYIF